MDTEAAATPTCSDVLPVQKRTPKLSEQLHTPCVHARPSHHDLGPATTVAEAVNDDDQIRPSDGHPVSPPCVDTVISNRSMAPFRNGVYEAHCFRSHVSNIMMVIDVEALVLGSIGKYVVEQVAYVVVNGYGKEMTSCKCTIFQPLNAKELVSAIGCSFEEVSTAIYHYKRITRDASYIHADVSFPDWDTMKDIITLTQRRFNATVYAKGAKMESQLFCDSFHVHELALYGCPKYPQPVHDPLSECFFFAQYLPYKHAPQQTFCYLPIRQAPSWYPPPAPPSTSAPHMHSIRDGNYPTQQHQCEGEQILGEKLAVEPSVPPVSLPPVVVPCTAHGSSTTHLATAVDVLHTPHTPKPPPHKPSYADIVTRVGGAETGAAAAVYETPVVRMDPKTVDFMPRQRKPSGVMQISVMSTPSLPFLRSGGIGTDTGRTHMSGGGGCGSYNRVSTVSGGVLQSTTFYMWCS